MTTQVRPIGASGTVNRLARWTLGMAIAGIRYIFSRVPFYRRTRGMIDGDDPAMPDLERELPGDPDSLQRASSGEGPLFHRRYTIFVTDEQLGAEALIDHILEDPNRVAPSRMARFETPGGELATNVDLGDELVVRLPGPWDGPVRVIERTPTSFRLATLDGHLEAGEIEFATGYDDRGFLCFRIESWSRSGDRVFLWLHERFPIGREMQLHMWSQFCQRVAAASGGTRMSSVSSTTRRTPLRIADTPHGQLVASAPVSRRALRAYADWTGRELNFEPIDYEQALADPAWHVDERCSELPAERPGEPEPDGPFVVARDVLVGYEFADPALVRAVYDASSDFEGRTMLLVGRFLGLRFHMGVRVAGVVDEQLQWDGRPVQRFRWHYRTLDGHLERGHMDYELLKWFDTGSVEFRIRAYSQRADIANPIVRVGFCLFGRWTQLRFYDRSISRMQHFVAERAAIIPLIEDST